MKKSDSILEDRIRWRFKKHDLPTRHTVFWEDRPSELDTEVPSLLGKAMLLSMRNISNYIVICTRGSLVVVDGEPQNILFSDVTAITDFPMESGEEKGDLICLKFELNSGKEVMFYPEPFKPAFSVWNILIMLMRMS